MTQPNTFPVAAFLPPPQGTWDARRRVWTGAPAVGAQLQRVRLTLQDRDWLVYFPSVVAQVELPPSPEPGGAAFQHVQVEAFQFVAEGRSRAFMEEQGNAEPDGLGAFSSCRF